MKIEKIKLPLIYLVKKTIVTEVNPKYKNWLCCIISTLTRGAL